ncbi:MAG: CtsR family transcriptional regulator [Thermoanaerobacterales bacterium]|nr:CtsR family transcriptional regulator [Bacillota bacterium]MDI6907542.1 CtsR family transcriptional regulator [Thermoanaerobacterales bacterium]
MPSIADLISAYILELLADSPGGVVEIRRNDLALRFNCVPSQVTYVLATRFSPQSGFMVESRRGGGGYVRIAKIPFGRSALLTQLQRLIGAEIGAREAHLFIRRLEEENLISYREALLMRGAVGEDLSGVSPSDRNAVRASLLKNMLAALWSGGSG